MDTFDQTMRQVYDWAIVRIHYLSNIDPDAAYAIQSEFSEWMNPNTPEVNVFSVTYEGDSNEN